LWHIAFESVEKARAWYDSPAYQELVAVRKRLRQQNFLSLKACQTEDSANPKKDVSKQGDEP
jgi:hypothetical protein